MLRVSRGTGHEVRHTKLETLCCLISDDIWQHSVSIRVVTLSLRFVLTYVI
jgi:hypothetical protein